ncbi:MAG: NAD(P)/FAD-dependent oxidoreductase [Solirubrobacterales bacterium]
MPVRATKRGILRTPIGGDYDVVICGASFAGLSVARELRGSGARVLVLDRYDIGERATSACATPTIWLERMGLGAAIRQSFDSLTIQVEDRPVRFKTPWPFSTFDYRRLCELLAAQGDFEFETATVRGPAVLSGVAPNAPVVISTDRGDVRAPLVVDALGWRRVLAPDRERPQPPAALLSRGLEVHPAGSSDHLKIWIDQRLVAAGYGWSFPAGDELRVGVGSFDPRDHVREPTVRLAESEGLMAERFQGNWIPHALRPATDGVVFCAGDSAGHCLPLSAEGIRTAFYFGIACGRELRSVLDGRFERATALRRYREFSASHERAFRLLLRAQRTLPRVPVSALSAAVRLMSVRGVDRRWMNRYLNAAHPDFVHSGGTAV